jgi:hypothetical protein
VTIERESQERKHRLQRFSTDEEMQIDESDEQLKNAYMATDESREPDSKVTLQRRRHS